MEFVGNAWDDTIGGPMPDKGHGMFQNASTSGGGFAGSRKVTEGIVIAKPALYNRSLSLEGSPPASPTTSSPSTTPRDKENVWRSVFNPGSNRATKTIGSQKFDNAESHSPTVYDWLYSGDTKSKWR